MHHRFASLLVILPLLALLPGLTAPAAGQFPGLGQSTASDAKEPEEELFYDSRDHVEITAKAERSQVRPGEDFPIAVIFDHDEGWHVWTNQRELPERFDRFDGAIHTQLSVTTNDDDPLIAHPGAVQWPEPHAVEADLGMGEQTFAVFSGRAIAHLPVSVAADAAPGKVTLTVQVDFQACDDMSCAMPASVDLPVTVEVVPPDAALDAVDDAADGDFAAFDPSVFAAIHADEAATGSSVDEADDADDAAAAPIIARPTFFGFTLPETSGPLGVLLLALFAAIGGFILNLTPCVLPVIPIKIMTITQHAGSPGRNLALGAWMAIGVCAFWIGIGIPVAFFSSVTDPSRIFGIWWLTLGIGVIIALMGVGIMGLFTIRLPNSVYAVNPRADTLWGSFVFGVMTAVLGLPCFGFVAGALLAGAATLPAATVMAIFTCLGIGMALPYFVLSAKPSLIERIPRTGPASELVKQVMGLLLLAAAAYFIGSGTIALLSEHPYLGRQLHWWAVAFFAALATFWMIWRTFQITPKPMLRTSFTMIGAIIGGVAVLYAADSTNKARETWVAEMAARDEAGDADYVPGIWNPYTPDKLTAARSDGKIVVLDFTAEWCLNCKALKAGVLNREPVRSALADDDVITFTVDLTSTNAPGWDFLRELGQTGIPLLVIYSPGDDNPWQSNAYTSDQVLSALEDARQEQTIAKR